MMAVSTLSTSQNMLTDTLTPQAEAYLDGPGREDSKKLGRTDALTYASQSMRLTTRLMQVASWLLVQRALKEDEMTLSEARADKYRLVPEDKSKGTLSFSELAKDAYALPARLLDLLARSEQLYERIMRLDRSLYGSIAAQVGNTVADQINRLEAASPPVQAGCVLESISRTSVSPSLPYVERVSYVEPSTICTVIM